MKQDSPAKQMHKIDETLFSAASAASAFLKANESPSDERLEEAKVHFQTVMTNMTFAYKKVQERAIKAFKEQKSAPLSKKPTHSKKKTS